MHSRVSRGAGLAQVQLGHREEQARIWVQLPWVPPVWGDPALGVGQLPLGEGEEGAHAGWAVTASRR